LIFVLKNCGYAYYIHHLVNQYTRQVQVLLESFRDRKSATRSIWVFYFLTCLCFPKVDLIDNLFLSKVQNRRKTFFFSQQKFYGVPCRTSTEWTPSSHRYVGSRDDDKWRCCVIWCLPYNHMEVSTEFQDHWRR
jgi:hypothetical protein